MDRPLRYVQINEYSHGWAESIVFGKHKDLLDQGADSYVFWGRGREAKAPCEMRITSFPEVCVDAGLSRIDGRAGFHSRRATARLLHRLEEIGPDVVHLHVLHGYYLNVEMLFDWLSRRDCDVVWTLHDCWPFTGHCQYFTSVGCDAWKEGCPGDKSCPQIKTYPQTFNKRSVSWNYENKKRIFTSISADRMKLIVPSEWLAGLVSESFLAKYPVEVVRNEVNPSIFKPTVSDFREKFGIGNRFMILGVANAWTERKGLGDFVQLAELLNSEQFAVVLIGLKPKQVKALKNQLLGLPRVQSAADLAAIYTAADILFNPTREDNYPTVNLEAQACGTVVGTYPTGGSPETLSLEGSFTCADLKSFVNRCKEMASRPSSGCGDSSGINGCVQ